MKSLSPIAARFTRGLEGYVHPARLEAWEQAAAGPESVGIGWPGVGTISCSSCGCDDCDE
ncbi:MAG: hypothetical protein L0H25_04400 [Micrococcales bacterium]|nr:hypothetical protein [Micrococcales bacterium]